MSKEVSFKNRDRFVQLGIANAWSVTREAGREGRCQPLTH